MVDVLESEVVHNVDQLSDDVSTIYYRVNKMSPDLKLLIGISCKKLFSP